jgi:hypothetical protein
MLGEVKRAKEKDYRRNSIFGLLNEMKQQQVYLVCSEKKFED